MKKLITTALTFDDVLLVPKRSSVKSRKDVSVSTKLTRNISMKIPIISANMDTVTEAKMAKRMAVEGGIGIIHRFLDINEQVAEVLKVKRSESMVVENPYTFSPNKTVADAKEFMKEFDVGGLLIVNEKEKLIGILSRRDVLFADNTSLVSDVMTRNPVTIKKQISLEEAKKLLFKHRIEKLPIVDDNGNIRGLITSEDIRKVQDHPLALKDKKGRLMVGAAIGVKEGFLKRAAALIKAGADVLVVDIAHGHSDLAINTVKSLKKHFPKTDVIAGNVATAEGTYDLIKAGADAVKVGVGPGSICITRIVAGSGVPQLSAVMACAKVAKKYGVPIIADGGVKTSGDLIKALAAGASTVMCGNILAGTKEAPGLIILRNGRRYKVSRGMASFGASLGRKTREGNMDDGLDIVPEGVEAMVPYKGDAKAVLHQLIGGLRSGISYCGAKSIPQMQKNAEFVKITSGGLRESKPHDVELI